MIDLKPEQQKKYRKQAIKTFFFCFFYLVTFAGAITHTIYEIFNTNFYITAMYYIAITVVISRVLLIELFYHGHELQLIIERSLRRSKLNKKQEKRNQQNATTL